MRGFVFGFLAALLMIGVGSAQWGQQGVYFQTYRSGQHGQINVPRTVFLISQGDLDRTWPQLTGEPASKAPKDVKWNSEQLLLITLGERPSSGYSVFVKSVERNAGNLEITYVEKTPPPGAPSLTVMTSPWVLVKMPKMAGFPVFRKETSNYGGIVVIPGGKPGCCSCGCPCCSGR
jgi:hypothetical protein